MQLTDAYCCTVGAFEEADVGPAAAAPAAATAAGAADGAAAAADTAAAGEVLVVLPRELSMEEVEVCEPVDGTFGALEGNIDCIFCLTNKEPAGMNGTRASVGRDCCSARRRYRAGRRLTSPCDAAEPARGVQRAGWTQI